MRLGLALLGVCVSLLACAYPSSTTRGVDDQPMLIVTGAPDGSRLVVDGIDAGPAANFSGEQALSIRPGRHVIEIQLEGRVLHRQEVYLGSGTTKTIAVEGSG